MEQRHHFCRCVGNKSFGRVILVCVLRDVWRTQIRPICCSAHNWGLLARFVPLEKPELSLCVQMSFALPKTKTLDGALFDINSWSEHSAFGLSGEICWSDVVVNHIRIVGIFNLILQMVLWQLRWILGCCLVFGPWLCLLKWIYLWGGLCLLSLVVVQI